LVLLSGCDGPTESETARPSVLVLTLDTTRADHLSCYGYVRATSPRLDELAAGGVLFKRAMAQASVTPVSHASIFTGQWPYHHGLRFLHGESGFELPERAETLAEILEAEGFDTAAFISAFPAGTRFGLQQGFGVFDEAFLVGDSTDVVSEQGVVNTGRNQRTAAETNEAVFEWLAGRPEAPFFLWVHYFDPHDTHVLPEDPAFRSRFAPRDSSAESWYRAQYDCEIAYADHHLGKLIDRLERETRELLIVVVGDHGQGLGDHDWWSHGLLYDEQIRVPLILHGPDVPPGRRVRSLVRTIDVVPTLLALLRVDAYPDAGIDGVSLQPLFREPEESLRLDAYSEATTLLTYNVPYAPDEPNRRNDQLFSLIRGEWKYVRHRFGLQPDEIYNLVDDPEETENLIDVEAAVGVEMRRSLRPETIYPRETPMLGGMTEQDLERLRSLGYVAGSSGP
jgi:arylsulfatase A-like enzyme